jgi:hypothetical protein
MKNAIVICFLMCFASPIFASGTTEVPCKISLKNTVPYAVTVTVKATNTKGETVYTMHHDLDAAVWNSATPGTEATATAPATPGASASLKTATTWDSDQLKLPGGSNIEATYSSVTSTAEYKAKGSPITLPKDTKLAQSVAFSVTSDFFDQTSAKAAIDSLKPYLGPLSADTKVQPSYERLKQQLNQLTVLDKDGKAIDFITLPADTLFKVNDVQPALHTIKNTVYLNDSLITSLDVTVPLFGNLKNSLNLSKFYSVKIDVTYFDDSTQTPVRQIIGTLDNAALIKIKNLLNSYSSDGSVTFISGYRTLKSAVFSYCEGTKVEGTLATEISSVFTANGSYHFEQGQENYITAENLVIRIETLALGKVSSLLAYVSSLIAAPATTALTRRWFDIAPTLLPDSLPKMALPFDKWSPNLQQDFLKRLSTVSAESLGSGR